MLRRFSALAAVLAMAGAPAATGPVLDDIMNTMKLDAQTSGPDMDKFRTIEPGKPLGQTFTTGDDLYRIDRICISVAYWHENWEPGESLVLTLWDSPEKKRQLGRDAIPYGRRQWEGAILIYRLNAAAEPRTRYYYELTVEGGDGQIVGKFFASRDYLDGQAYEAGVPQDYDFYFEVNVKQHADLDVLYQEQFDNFDLDYPGLEQVKATVAKRDWETACRELVAYFEGRADLVDPGRTICQKNLGFDPTHADLVVEQKHLDRGVLVDLGPDWNYLATWPTRGGVGLTRSGLRKYLAAGYSQTCDEKYAVAFNSMMESFFRNFPSPIKSGVISGKEQIGPTFKSGIAGGSMWASLSIAARMGHGFYYYTPFVGSPNVKLDSRAAWIFSLVDMANVLELMKAGGNWETQNTKALAEFGLTYPELKKSKRWVKQGRDGLIANFMKTVRPDGTLGEASVNYVMLCINRYLWLLEQPAEAGLDPPAQVRARLEKMLEYIMYSTQPDWLLPAWGDSNWASGEGLLRRGAALYGRDDFLWVATQGKQGKPPARTSVAFPDGGYFVMRSAWPGATLMLHNGHSTGHGHRDANSVVISMEGKQVVTDPGIWTYGTPEATELTATRSHATMTVDGCDTKNGDGQNRWVSMSHFDYFDGTNAGFEGSDVLHRRRIVFIKPHTWVICDQVRGSGEHQFDIRFPFNGTATMDAEGRAVFPLSEKAEAYVLPVHTANMQPVLDKGMMAITRGDQPTPISVARHGRRAAAGEQFRTLFVTAVGVQLTPEAMESTTAPLYPVTTEPLAEEAGARVYRLQLVGGAEQIVRFADPSLGPTPANGECQVVGRRPIRPRERAVSGVFWIDGRIARDGERIIAESGTPMAALQVGYDRDTLHIDTEGQDPTLRVWTQGATRLIVNSGPARKIAAGAEYLTPF